MQVSVAEAGAEQQFEAGPHSLDSGPPSPGGEPRRRISELLAPRDSGDLFVGSPARTATNAASSSGPPSTSMRGGIPSGRFGASGEGMPGTHWHAGSHLTSSMSSLELNGYQAQAHPRYVVTK